MGLAWFVTRLNFHNVIAASQLFDERDRPGTDIMAVKFTPKRKRYTRACRTADGMKVTVFSKGASELNLSRCTKMIGHNGKVKDLDE